MKRSLAPVALAAALVLAAPAQAQRNVRPAVNVNSRYTVESVELEGIEKANLSQGLRRELDGLVGRLFDQSSLNHWMDRLRSEVRIKSIETRLARGSEPNSIRVVIEVHRRRDDVDISASKLAYQSAGEGFTGALDSTVRFGNHLVGGGVLSDGTNLMERYAGVNAHYEYRPLGDPRLRVRFDYENYHQQWNNATRFAAAAATQNGEPGTYSARQNYQPTLTVEVAPGLTVSAGASFENIDFDLPAAPGQSSNAAITTLRYRRAWSGLATPDRDELEAGYSLRAATSVLGSDFVYARHAVHLNWARVRGHRRLELQARAGSLSGRAPLYDRFVLGNSALLRGWSKFELAPLGGQHFEYASVQGAWRWLQAYYDTGAIWNQGDGVVQRHAAGFGVGSETFLIAVGFPLRNGRHDPVFFMAVKF
jgi:hypothetical protein